MANLHGGGPKPSRSESGELLSAEEKEKYAKQVQEFLHANAPTRPLKPSRSDMGEHEAGLGEVPANSYATEVKKLEELIAEGKLLKTEGGTVNDESYSETTYYDDLNSVDKNFHHETGTGFIDKGAGGNAFVIGADSAKVFKIINKSNPATNEWEPSPTEKSEEAPRVYRSEADVSK